MAQLLTAPFTQLSVVFDPQPILCEVNRLDKSTWIEHRLKNLYSIPLVAGIDDNVTWCSVIEQLPHLRALLHTWNAPLGKTRISILEPGASVDVHVDIDYYWKHRLRVHIVLQTNPQALFGCGKDILSLPAGQLWVSNNWAPHWISNNGNSNRIHIVVDTVGSPTLWKWINQGWNSTSGLRRPETKDLPCLSLAQKNTHLHLEYSSRQAIRSPAQLQEIADDCLNDMRETASLQDITLCQSQLRILILTWRSIYHQHNQDPAAYPLYTSALTKALNALPNPIFWNGVDLHTTLRTQVGKPLMSTPAVKYPVTDEAHTTQG